MLSVAYKATESKGQVSQFPARYSGAYEIACSSLDIIRGHGKIPRQKLIDKLIGSGSHYSQTSLEAGVISVVVAALADQGLIEKITAEGSQQKIAIGLLTHTQFHNYARWLRKSGVFTDYGDKRKNGESGVYSEQETDVLNRVGECISDGIRPVHAIQFAVREVFGDEAVDKFKTWYAEDVKRRSAHDKELRDAQRDDSIVRLDNPPLVSVYDFNAALKIYDDSEYRSGNGRTSPLQKHLHDSILERLLNNYFQQSGRFAKRFPFSLYFMLTEPELDPRSRGATVARVGLDVAMQNRPEKSFSHFGEEVFKRFNESLDRLTVRIEARLKRGLTESRQAIIKLQDNSLRRGINIVEMRYSSGVMLPLEDIGHGIGVSKEMVRQIEKRGIKLLGQQPAIQDLLSYPFWEIPGYPAKF